MRYAIAYGTLYVFMDKKRLPEGAGFPDAPGFCINYTLSDVIFAEKNSRFIRAILLRLMPLGHSTSHAPVLVQDPKPSASIWAIILSTLVFRSGLPCGNSAN